MIDDCTDAHLSVMASSYRLSPIDVGWLKQHMYEAERVSEPEKPSVWSFQPRSPFVPMHTSVWRLSVATQAIQRDVQRYVQWLAWRQMYRQQGLPVEMIDGLTMDV